MKMKFRKFDPDKIRPVFLASGTISVDKFRTRLITEAVTELHKHPRIAQACGTPDDFFEVVEEYAKAKGVLKAEAPEVAIEVPEHYDELTLNIDESHTGRDLKFFMTTRKETVSEVSGNVYLRVCGLKEDEAIAVARKVVPDYRPRSRPGIIKKKSITGEPIQVFNSYIPPQWTRFEEKTPSSLPPLFEKLVTHLFPVKLEREYFYDWLHDSLFGRAYVYLILCGPGGTGKNRLKLVMRALHGHQNTVDGKRSTLTDRFNAQLAESTLAWFDELHYDLELENVMKEIQNDSISIERKGVDATRSTKIHASLAISNNKPRDNYIAFDGRKFVPLQVTNVRLDKVMSRKELDDITDKVQDWSSKNFDMSFVAQIGRWLKKRGNSRKWPHLEYKGPMFYKLAHTSMSRWQKKAATIVLDGEKSLASGRIVLDREKGFLWSSVADSLGKKNGDRSLQFPDYSTVQHFFNIFVDSEGRKTFKTQGLQRNVMGDFYVKLINKDARILTEAEVIQGEADEEIDL